MNVFDALAGNAGRTAAELRYSPGSWQLALTGNRRLFATSASIPAYLSGQRLEVSPALTARLRALDPQAAAAALGDVLDGRRVEAILARRDLLLARQGD
jgi:hypothetical protein